MEDKRSDILAAIKNPLSIIALFVLILDIVMAIVIANSHITDNQRSILIWFFVLFPIIVLAAFFVLVWYKPENLYGPKDYSDEAIFYKLMRRVKIEKEVDEVVEEAPTESGPGQRLATEPSVSRASIMSQIELSEHWALSEIEKEFKVKVQIPNRQKLLFYDGEFIKDSTKYRIEVKYLRQRLSGSKVFQSLERFLHLSNDGAISIIAIVSDYPWSEDDRKSFEFRFQHISSKVLFRYYTLPINN